MPACPLCLTILPSDQLRVSHVIPRFCYKRLRQRLGHDPMQITEPMVRERHPAQVKERMLCQKCERRMQVGEDYIAGIAYDRNGDCPLFSLAGYSSPVRDISHAGQPHVKVVSALDPVRIEYFTLSVFWRASICSILPYRLDEPASDLFRRYLLGEADRPQCVTNISMVVVDQPRHFDGVRFDEVINFPWIVHAGQLPAFPGSRLQVPYALHSFQASGLVFRMVVGGAEWLRQSDVSKKAVIFQSGNQLWEIGGMHSLVQHHSEKS